MNMTICIISLCAAFTVYAVISHLERKDLYNRLMSRDFSEYTKNTEKINTEPRISAHREAIEKFHNKGL